MEDFRAIVQAELDRQRFDADMNALQNERFELQNVHILTRHFVNEIQNALSRNQFDVHLNPVFNNRAANNIGRQYGAQFVDGIQTEINGLDRRAVGQTLNRALGDLGMSAQAVDNVIRGLSDDIDNINLQVRQVTNQFVSASDAANGLRNIRINGIDNNGNEVNIYARIDDTTGRILDTSTRITQNFDNSAEAARQVNDAFSRLVSIQKEINSNRIEIMKLDPEKDRQQIEVLTDRINDLQREYVGLYTSFSGGFTENQFDQLVDESNRAVSAVERLRSKFQDKIRFEIDTGKIDADLIKIEHQISSIRSTGKADPIELINLDSALADLRTLRTEMDNHDGDELRRSYEELKNTLESVKNSVSELSSESKEMVSSLETATLSNKMQKWLDKNTKAVNDYGVTIRNLIEQLRDPNISVERYKTIERAFKSITQEAEAAGKTGRSFIERIKSALTGTLGIAINAEIIFDKAVDGIRKMYDVVYDVDTAMTELRKVTEETEEAYIKFLNNAGKVAKQIGTTISDYISSTADFARLGYSLNEAEELAKVANIYSVVGDDLNGIEEATGSIISTLTAFNIKAGESINIVDKFNAVGNSFAISSGGIGEALANSASSLAAANNTIDESIALITAANTVVQNPESVGTAFKTLSMRIRGAKTDLEEAGLDADGMANSISELRSEIKALSGVDIMLDDKTFKSTYQIIKELSEVWKELSDVSQANVIELIAGKRQGNIMASLMNNFNIAEKVLNTSINSSGSAMKEHSKWMDSLEAKTQQFKASFQELSTVVLDSDFLKGLVDSGTAFLTVLTKIVDTLGVFNTLAIGGGIAALVKNFD